MSRRTDHFPVLALALLQGRWTRNALRKRARDLLGPRSKTRANRLVDEILAVHRLPYTPGWRTLTKIVAGASALHGLSDATIERVASTPGRQRPPRFEPIAPLQPASAPTLATIADLATWLEIPIDHLDWFADERRTLDREQDEALSHYAYHWRLKRSGAWRLIEAPKPRMMAVQRRILKDILNRLAPHEAAHGFVAGRSCVTAAAKHAGEHVVVTVDLRDFFLSAPVGRVHAIFRCLGYPHAVARALTGLCSTSTPRHVAAEHFDHEAQRRHATRHLPQGAPTSPALSNLAALGLDRRLAGLANRFGARYTRYADDLTFSGDSPFCARVPGLLKAVADIARDEGFALNAAKTRIMPRHQRQSVTGIVVNDHINFARDDFYRLKAALTNCVRHGPASQNRDAHPDFRAHLDGRITWVERLNLRRGEKLRRLFDAIAW